MGSPLTILPDILIVGSFFISALIHTYFLCHIGGLSFNIGNF